MDPDHKERGQSGPSLELAIPHWNRGKYDRRSAKACRARRSHRVLVVDDDRELAEALSDLHGDLGYEIVGIAPDGQVAVDLSQELQPEVVVMDLRMAGLGGIAATAEIRTLFPNIQIVVLSAYDDESLRRDARRAGAFAYLPKGASVELIDKTIIAAAAAGAGVDGDGTAAASDLRE